MTPAPWPRWMSLETAARYLDRSPSALKTLRQRGQIPSALVAGRVVFGKTELDAWVQSGGKVTAEAPRIGEGM